MGTVKIPIYIYTLRMSFLSLVCSFCVPFLFFHKIKKDRNTCIYKHSSLLKKQGMRESNSHQRFWRPLSYHLTNPLHYLLYTFKTSYRLLDFLNSLNPTYSLIRMLHRKTLARFRFASSRYVLLRKTLHEHSTISADESARCFHVHSSSFSAFLD